MGVLRRPGGPRHRDRGPPRDGELLLTDGPFAETKEYVGGISIVEAPDLDAALEWGFRSARAIGLPIEVRPFHWA
jgi:hypothetical protein